MNWIQKIWRKIKIRFFFRKDEPLERLQRNLLMGEDIVTKIGEDALQIGEEILGGKRNLDIDVGVKLTKKEG